MTHRSSESIVRDPSLAPEGHRKIDWAAEHSPVLNTVRDRYLKDGTFRGLGVGVALPIEAKTAYLTVVLAEAGADVAVASPGPFFVQDDVAAALAERGVTVYASSEADPGEADRKMERVLDRVLGGKEAVLIDDRAGLVRLAHTTRRELLPRIRGASEETTSGVAKFRAMERERVLEFPVIAANDARCKYLFDNRYGTGQSTLTAIMQSTNLMVGGKRVVVLGYGAGAAKASRATRRAWGRGYLSARWTPCVVSKPTPTGSTFCRPWRRRRSGRYL